jgi:hypothetical protein
LLHLNRALSTNLRYKNLAVVSGTNPITSLAECLLALGFTGGVFRCVAVFAAAAIRERSLAVGHTVNLLRKIPEQRLFSTHLTLLP